MKNDGLLNFSKRIDELSRRDRVFLNNPVIMQGLGLAPIVVPATSLKNAVMLAVAVILLLTPTRMIATAIAQRLGLQARAIIYSFTSALVFIGVAYVMDRMFGTALSAVGIYLPLFVLEPLIIKRYESGKKERLSTSLKKGVITTVGYCIVLFFVAGLRELLATGMLGGVEIFRFSLLPIAAMPAGGFIILGAITAVWRGAVISFKKRAHAGGGKQQ